jgi:3'-phosphoadenosine 5'-phosphosulfate sulfotransferase (PAPS reductase)/FAD synthetase
MTNPYLITGPALISFSGGRTSAFMLRQILDAHGGTLPDDVVVAFANTGKEREETLRFVHECGVRWGVPIVWVEFVIDYGPLPGRFEVVGYNSASRNGEPLARLIKSKQFTPNSMMRFCTEDAKVETINAYLKVERGMSGGTKVLGIRHDEGGRLLKGYAKNAEGSDPWRRYYPLDKARVTKADVTAFWAAQDFDLGLRGYEGNCDLCFMKGRGTLKTIIRENPGAVDWWIEQERIGKGRFRKDYSYADLAREVREQPTLFGDAPDEEFDAECGLWCGPEENQTEAMETA